MKKTIQPESVSFGSRVDLDAEKGIVRNVKILGLKSRHGYTYTPAAVRKAAPLYEGVRVNIDHPDRKAPGQSRSYKDRFGFLNNVRFVEGKGLFGDFRFNAKHPIAEQFIWDVSNAPDNCGFSHVAYGPLTEKPDGSLCCESINKVRSVDLVADAATTESLFEGKPRMKTKVKRRKASQSRIRTREKLVESFGAKRAKFLLESLDPAAASSLANTADANGGGDDSNVEALIALIRRVLADPKISAEDSIKQVTKRLKALKDMIPGGTAAASDSTGGDAATMEDDGDDEEGDEEAVRMEGKGGKKASSLEARLAALEAQNEELALTALCEGAGFRPTKKQRGILAKVKDKDAREALIESWQDDDEEKPAKKHKAKSRDLIEAETEDDGEEYATTKDWVSGLVR